MRNLEDPRIAGLVKRTSEAARAAGLNVPKTTEAGVHAYFEAVDHPGSLVRVTSKTDDESTDVLFSISAGDQRHGNIDWVKTGHKNAEIDNNVDHTLAFIVEFKNGSAIELRTGK